jgi:hypothetical protein
MERRFVSDDAQMVAGAIAGNFMPLTRVMAASGLAVSGLQWDPPLGALREPALAFLLTYWQGLRESHGQALPHIDRIEPLDMRPALGNVMLLEAEEGGDDYRYRLYGSRIAERSGFDLTGKRTRDIRTHAAIGLLYRVLYAAVSVRQAALFSRHVSPATVGVRYWDHLILPMTDASGQPRHFLVGNVPCDGAPN